MFGEFRLTTRLGQGGMGEVWKAVGPGPSGPADTVVVKRLLPHLVSDLDMERSFSREARLCEKLRHPNIVRVFASGRVEDTMYLSMEYLQGVDLHRMLRAAHARGVVAPVWFAAYAARGVCRALHYAYAEARESTQPLRLVHRDVTPTNVMLTLSGEVKLLDFGIAKALSETTESRTSTGTLKGKLGYMAPEQLEGSPADHRSDQFSVGVLLHEALVGNRLFRGESDVQTLARVKACKVAPPSELGAGSAGALDEICLRALSQDPTMRFPDCGAMADALDRVIAASGNGQVEVAALIADMFPRGAGEAQLGVVADNDRVPTVAHPLTAQPGPKKWLALTVFVGACAVVGAALGLRASEQAAVRVAPPVVPPIAVARPETPPPATTTAPVDRASTHLIADDVKRRAHRVEKSVARVPRAVAATVSLAAEPPRPVVAQPHPQAHTGPHPQDAQIRQGQMVDPFAQ